MANTKIGFLFPGQGAQFVGMGKDIYAHFPEAKNIYDQADEILGYSIRKICFEGPEEDLTLTNYAQPAIFTTSLAALASLKKIYGEIRPSFCAGLSLGEFTSLVAAGSLTFADGLRLVQKRAEAMGKAATVHSGTMASIVGLNQKECESIAKEAGCEVANLNAPDQIVLSGSVTTVQKGCELADGMGAKRAIMLKVGGAFHSSLMKLAEEDLKQALRETQILKPQCTFIPNAIAESVDNSEAIRGLLSKQLTSPVRWVETMLQAKASSVQIFLEIGPGKVLKGLARRCDRELTVESCGSVEEIQKLDKLFSNSK